MCVDTDDGSFVVPLWELGLGQEVSTDENEDLDAAFGRSHLFLPLAFYVAHEGSWSSERKTCQ